MKYEKDISNSKFVFTRDEIGYQEVLEDFSNTNYILIITFNISEKNNYLIDYLERASQETVIDIFSNIPQRYERYYSERARLQARDKINVYLKRLDPENFESLVNTHFCFNNHSKIILTNNIVYIGSANFSDESQKNFESGFIIKDKDFILFLKNNIVPLLKNNSEAYYSDNAIRLKMLLTIAYSKLNNSYEEFYMSTHGIHDHAGREHIYFDIHNNRVNLPNIENLYIDLEEIEEILSVIIEELNDEGLLTNELENLAESINIENLKNQLTYDTPIHDLAKFDEEEYAMEYIQDNVMEAYDEYLAEFQEQGVQNAHDEKCRLAEEAKSEILTLIDSLKRLNTNIEGMLNIFPKSNINIDIDNT